MHKDGPLFIKYIIEKNEGFAGEVDDMVKKDNIAQLLMGDELKQDQLKFMYDTMKIIYDSALQKKLVDMKKDKEKGKVFEDTLIPELIAYHSIMRIRNIQLRKYNEAKKAREKAERDGKPVESAEEEKDPTKMTEEEIYAKKLEMEQSGGLTMSE